jgi:hypothetical protein
MKYTVIWADSTQAELANMWLDAKNKQAVTKASDEIDRLLAIQSHDVVLKFPQQPQLMSLGCLAVVYEVSSKDCLVKVLGVWSV